MGRSDAVGLPAVTPRSTRSFVGCIILLGFWFAAAAIGSPLLPSPLDVVASLAELAGKGILAEDTGASLYRVLCGVGIATALGCLLAALSFAWPPLSEFLSGPVELARPIPPIAWIPLAIMLFGTGNSSAVAIVGLAAFFPIWLGAQQGLDRLRSPHLRAARSLGAGRWILLTDIVVPSVAPYFLHGMRIGVGLAWFSVVAAEMMGARSGLGNGIQLFSLNLQIAPLYAYLLVIGGIGFMLNLMLSRAVDRVGWWQSGARDLG